MSAIYDKYSVTQYSVSSILGYIEAGDIAIPEIQRPLVWKASQVRDLIDSLYNGYTTGYLIPNVRLKDGKESVGKKILIDGQQRVTALMTAISGRAILTDDYEEKTIKIAFNPLAFEGEERFAVQTPAHINGKFWLPDISEVFLPSFSTRKYINTYLEQNPDVDETLIDQAITQLLSIRSCQIARSCWFRSWILVKSLRSLCASILKASVSTRLTLRCLRSLLMINTVVTCFVKPSITSAIWQLNPASINNLLQATLGLWQANMLIVSNG